VLIKSFVGIMKTKRTRKYRLFRTTYACSPPPVEYNTVSFVQCSPGVADIPDIVERRFMKSRDFHVGRVRKTGDIFRKNQPIPKVFSL
jgi:hypothetical protein